MSILDGKYLIKILSNWVGDSLFHVNGQQGKWEEKPKVDWVTTKPVHTRWDFTVQEMDRPFPYNNNNNKEKQTPYGGGGPSGRLDVVN